MRMAPLCTTLQQQLSCEIFWMQSGFMAIPDGGKLLVQHFGLDALDVGLLAATSDEETRQKLRDSLAKIIEVVGANSQIIEELAVKAQQRQRDVNLMRKLGLAVQQCVLEVLEERGLKVDPDDYGYGFLISVNEDDPEELSSQFQIAQYKVEVKTTTTGEPRLTPLQGIWPQQSALRRRLADGQRAFRTQLELTLVRLREFRRDPIHERSQGAALPTCTRKCQMMAYVSNVDRTTDQRGHQSARCHFTLSQTSRFQSDADTTACHGYREEAAIKTHSVDGRRFKSVRGEPLMPLHLLNV